MSDSDDVLGRVQQATGVAREVQETVQQIRDGQVPVQQVGPLVNALRQIPEFQQATQQVQRAGQVARQVVDVAESIAGASSALDALSNVAQAIAGGLNPVEKVQFKFESSADPGGTWRVVELHAREGLSELNACTVELANENLGADVDALLGSSAEVLISREASARRLCGIIRRVEHMGTKPRALPPGLLLPG